MASFRATDFERSRLELEGWPVALTCYQLPDGWHARVDNVSPGATIARALGQSRDEAVESALARAAAHLKRTRRIPPEEA